MLCYAMLCDAMLCYAMLCDAMLCYAMLCYAMLCYAMLCYAMLCYATRRAGSFRPPSRAAARSYRVGRAGRGAFLRSGGPRAKGSARSSAEGDRARGARAPRRIARMGTVCLLMSSFVRIIAYT
jgi:hypothetical protein